MSERQQMLGQRVDLRVKCQRQKATCEALRDKLRGLLSKLEEIEMLESQGIVDTALALGQELDDLKLMVRKIAILNQELGE